MISCMPQMKLRESFASAFFFLARSVHWHFIFLNKDAFVGETLATLKDRLRMHHGSVDGGNREALTETQKRHLRRLGNLFPKHNNDGVRSHYSAIEYVALASLNQYMNK